MFLQIALFVVACLGDDAFLIDCAMRKPVCDSFWQKQCPSTFRVQVPTSHGSFTVFVNKSWAPVMAERFYLLAELKYASGGPFYRVLRHNQSSSFVAQWGYRGSVEVDMAWREFQTSTATERVRLSNVRGTVAFGTGEIANTGRNPNCSAATCSSGFSVELFVNTADNSAKLDAMDFSPFGIVEDMSALDELYARYGELSDLCTQEPGDSYCVKTAQGDWAGVNLTRFYLEGNPYLKSDFPFLDYAL